MNLKHENKKTKKTPQCQGMKKSRIVLLVKGVIWGPVGRRCNLKKLGQSHTRLDWLHQAALGQNHAGLAL